VPIVLLARRLDHLLMSVWWLVSVSMIATGSITDGNGVAIPPDQSLLIFRRIGEHD